MPSPFPGMDPYLESQGRWRDFHSHVITYCCDTLNASLPEHYVAQIEERLTLVEVDDLGSRALYSDVAVLREDWPVPVPAGAAAVATIEPVSVPLARHDPEEVRETYIEILRLPDCDLVTVIEVLSPTNKVGRGRAEYLDKRAALLDRPVHLVEIDLLLGGHRMPAARPLPRGDYYAVVARAERRPTGEVYAWSIRRPLPTLPIPLRPPDPDVPLDLAAVSATAYERGRYARLVDYRAPLGLPLAAEDLAWAEGLARAAAR